MEQLSYCPPLVKRLAIVFIMLFGGLVSQAQTTLTGRVTDATTGEALPGSNIVVKSTQRGTDSDANGHLDQVRERAGLPLYEATKSTVRGIDF